MRNNMDKDFHIFAAAVTVINRKERRGLKKRHKWKRKKRE